MAARIGYLYDSLPGTFNIIDQFPAPLRKNLINTWAVAFREDVLPDLNEKPFECLYSATRLSTRILLNVAA